MNKQKYLQAALLTFMTGIGLLIYGIAMLGILTKDKIVVTTLATTGPDYDVVFGQLKLKNRLPDTSVNFDVNGIMTTGSGATSLGNYLQENYLAFGDYFVLTGKTVGIKTSDSDYFHPLIEISSWTHVDKVTFWVLAIFDFGLFLFAIVLYKKHTRQKTSAGIGIVKSGV